MKIFCLSDPHLGFGCDKPMDIYGPQWDNHSQKIKDNWLKQVSEQDLVIVPGDISWAKNAQELKPDMDFLAELPGKIILGKGNHENWWQSYTKTKHLIADNCTLLDASHPYFDGELAIVGSRMWDNPQIGFGPWIALNEGTTQRDLVTETNEQTEKIFKRELLRLERALSQLGDATIRIAALHYPPTNPDFVTTEVTDLLEQHNVQFCVFGHIHSLREDVRFYGHFKDIEYHLCSVDHIDFTPKLITEVI